MIKATMIMLHSTQGLAKKPNPTNGKLVNNTGTAAQWMAHSVEAVIPILSNLKLIFSNLIAQIYTSECNMIALKSIQTNSYFLMRL
jgi:hypothetical protein